MNPGFNKLDWTLECPTGDGRNFVLLDDIFYTTKAGVPYKIPAGTPSDGASTPKAIWETIPPFGLYWPAAYLHDAAYRNYLEVFVVEQGGWIKARLTEDVCNNLFDEAMELLGVPELERKVIYEGVVLFGKSSFDEDRKANP